MTSIKLGLLFLRTLAKPVANQIKSQAKQHDAFKEFCIRVAQMTHRVEVSQKIKVGDKLQAGEARPLNEAKAIEAGANFLGEAILFSVAAGGLLFENWRSRRNDARKAEEFNQNVQDVKDLDDRLASINDTLTDLNRVVVRLQHENREILTKLDGQVVGHALETVELPEERLKKKDLGKKETPVVEPVKTVKSPENVVKEASKHVKETVKAKEPVKEPIKESVKESKEEKKPVVETITDSLQDLARLDMGLLVLQDMDKIDWQTIGSLLDQDQSRLHAASWQELDKMSLSLEQSAKALHDISME